MSKAKTKGKQKFFLPPPKRCFLDVSTPRGGVDPVDTLHEEGECRSDVTVIVTMNSGSEVVAVGNVKGEPCDPRFRSKFKFGDRCERSFIFSKGKYEVRTSDRVVTFTMSSDGVTVESYGKES